MTVKKGSRCGGQAAIVARQKIHNTNQQIDIASINKSPQSYNITVGFNEKDQLQLLRKEINDDDKIKVKDYDIKCKQENIAIDEIFNCVNIDNYPNCENILVFYVTKNQNKESIALRFENEQDFKRIYFTYKYFKMRNRLTRNANNYTSSDSLFIKKKNDTYNKINDDYIINNKTKSEYDLQTVDNDGVTHISIQQKGAVPSRFDQPLSLIGLRNEIRDGEIDSVIYTDLDIPNKPEKKRLFHKKSKAPPPPPPLSKDTKVLKGEFVRVNVERSPDVLPKDNKHTKIPDLLVFRDNKSKKNNTNSNLWTVSNKVNNGYESDRDEWRNSRSQFSTTAFDSLARPTKMAMALTLKKPQRVEPVPQYFRLSSETKPKLTPLPFRPNNFLQRPRLPRLSPEIQRNLSTDHRKYTSLQSLELPKKLSEPKKQDVKKNYSNISHRITGLTNKLRDLGSGNTIGRFKSHDVALKPVLKMNDKRSVVRTCSAEPPKKVTFSAFATVQVV